MDCEKDNKKLGNIAKRLMTSSLIYGFGDIVVRSASIILIPVYTKLLTPADYGILGAVAILNAFISSIIVLSLNGALGRYHGDFDDENEIKKFYGSLFIFVVIWGGILTIALNLVGFIFLDHIFQSVRFDPYLRIGTWIAFFSGLSVLPLAMLQFQQRPGLYRIYTTAGFLLNTGLIILGVVVLKLGVLGSLYGQAISGLIMALLYIFLMGRNMKFHVSKKYLNMGLLFSLPLTVYALGGLITNMASRYFVERYTSLTDLGLYNLAAQYCMIMSVIFIAINMAWGPLFYEVGKRPDAKDIFAKYGLAIIFSALWFALFLTVFAPDVIALLASKAYQGATKLVPILLIESVLNVIWPLLINPLFLIKKTKYLSLFTGISAAGAITFNFLLTPSLGVIGAAIAMVLSNLMLNLVAFAFSHKLYPIPYNYKTILVILIIAIVLAPLSFFINTSSVFGNVLLKLLLIVMYPLILLYLNIFNKQDIYLVTSRVLNFGLIKRYKMG